MAKGKKAAPKGGRRSKKPTQDETVETRTVGIGDNSELKLPAPDDWNHHKKSIAGWREKVTTAQSHLRNAIKLAKKAGVNMESLSLVVGIERDNDPKKAASFFSQVGLGLELSESSLRVTVHDTLAGDEESLVYKRGYADGEAGRTPENKYPSGSDLAATYDRGWRHGTAKNLDMTPEQSDAAYEESQQEAAE